MKCSGLLNKNACICILFGLFLFVSLGHSNAQTTRTAYPGSDCLVPNCLRYEVGQASSGDTIIMSTVSFFLSCCYLLLRLNEHSEWTIYAWFTYRHKRGRYQYENSRIRCNNGCLCTDLLRCRRYLLHIYSLLGKQNTTDSRRIGTNSVIQNLIFETGAYHTVELSQISNNNAIVGKCTP